MDQEKFANTAPTYGTQNNVAPLDSADRGRGGRFVDSFKRNPNLHVTGKGQVTASGKVYDVASASLAVAEAPLSRKLKNRHLQMIAIGGSIGTGLFVGSGAALATGGPGALVLAFGLIGIMLFCTVQALGELAVLFPISGSFAAYSTRFLDPAWGFAMGWNYAMQWLVVLPLEIVAASITLRFWNPPGNPAAYVTIFYVLIIAINFFGVRGYAEAEVVFSMIKVIAVIGFIILGIILDAGGGPNHDHIGTQYWNNPGSFAAGFKGLCSVFVTAAFAFAGTELVGLAAAETANPRKTLPRAVKQVFWRITLFYIVSLAIVGSLVPYTDPRLLSGSSSVDAKASPFVIAVVNAGIPALPSIINVVILIAVLSVGNSSVYGSSRTLCALAEQGQAPRFLAYIDRTGRPLMAIVVASIIGLLCFLVATGKTGTIFGWMYALSGLSSIFTWGSICLCHIRFRRAWKKQGHTLDELAFRSPVGVIGSWVGFIFNCLVLIAQFWTALYPIGGEPDASSFFEVYLAAPIVIVFYLAFKIYKRPPFMRSHTMDLVTGRRELDLTQIIAEDKAEKARRPKWKKVWQFIC